MSTENPNYSIFFHLIERRGEKTERLIQEIKDLSIHHDIYDEVRLVNINPATIGADENQLVYSIETGSPTNKKAVDIISFLEHITKKMFDKYPAFTEPEQ